MKWKQSRFSYAVVVGAGGFCEIDAFVHVLQVANKKLTMVSANWKIPFYVASVAQR